MPVETYQSIFHRLILPEWGEISANFPQEEQSLSSVQELYNVGVNSGASFDAEVVYQSATEVRLLSLGDETRAYFAPIAEFMKHFSSANISDRVWYEFSPRLPSRAYELKQALDILKQRIDTSNEEMSALIKEERYIQRHNLSAILEEFKVASDRCIALKAAASTSTGGLHQYAHTHNDQVIAEIATSLSQKHAEVDVPLNKISKMSPKTLIQSQPRERLVKLAQDVKSISEAVVDVQTGINAFISTATELVKANKQYLILKKGAKHHNIGELLCMLDSVVDMRSKQLVAKDTMWTRIFYITCIMLLLSILGLGTYYSLEMHIPVKYVASGLGVGLFSIIGITCNHIYQQSCILHSPPSDYNPLRYTRGETRAMFDEPLTPDGVFLEANAPAHHHYSVV